SANGHVLADREAAKRLDDLERARDLVVGDHPRALTGDVLTADQDLAGGAPRVAGDQVDQRALARTVGADHPEDLSLGNREADIPKGPQATEPRRHAPALDHRH